MVNTRLINYFSFLGAITVTNFQVFPSRLCNTGYKSGTHSEKILIEPIQPL